MQHEIDLKLNYGKVDTHPSSNLDFSPKEKDYYNVLTYERMSTT